MRSKCKSEGLLSLVFKFNTDEKCRKFLEKVLWNDKPVCPYCKHHEKIYKFKDNKRYKCASCKRNFTVLYGTMFQNTHIPLTSWFYAILAMSGHKKGISSHQLARDINITQKNAWFMLHKIREGMNNNLFKHKMEGIVEMDETYVGGKNKNRHWNKKIRNAQGRSTKDKAIVFGMIEKETGRVITIPIKRFYKKGMQLIIRNKIKANSTIVTDEYRGYFGLRKHFNEHQIVNHSAYQYVCNGFSTNTIEGFWSFLKKGLVGIYHSVSKRLLHRYCDEFEFRYNTRELDYELRFKLLLTQFSGMIINRNNLF